jgi:hypothetical protein
MRMIGRLSLALAGWALLHQPSLGQYGYPGYGPNGSPPMAPMPGRQPMYAGQYPMYAGQYPAYQYPSQYGLGYAWNGQAQVPMQPAYRPQTAYPMQAQTAYPMQGAPSSYGYPVYHVAQGQATTQTPASVAPYTPAASSATPAAQPASPVTQRTPAMSDSLPAQPAAVEKKPDDTVTQLSKPLPAAPDADSAGGSRAPTPPKAEAGRATPVPDAPTAANPGCVSDEACPQSSRFGDHGTGAFADLLYWRVRGTDVIYGQPRDGIGILAVPRGEQGIVQPDYAAGFRVGGEFALSECSSIEASYLWWQNQSHSHLEAPAGTVIHSALTLPQTANAAADSLSASANTSFTLQVVDGVFKHTLCTDHSHYAVNWLAGARFAHLSEELHGDFTILGATAVDTHINFDGAGPRVGLEGELVGKSGLMVFGRGAANLLAGHFGAEYTQQNVFAGVQGATNYRSDRIVPVLELELGVGWTSEGGNLRASAGYYVAGWFNSFTTPDLIQGVQANNFATNGNNLRDTITFDGVMGRLEFRF